MSRRKGAGYERAIAQVFQKLGFTKARRLLEYQEGMGYDLENTGPFRVQCKRYRKYCSISKIEEVPKSSASIPLLVTKGDHKEDVVCLYLSDFVRILEDVGVAYEERESNE